VAPGIRQAKGKYDVNFVQLNLVVADAPRHDTIGKRFEHFCLLNFLRISFVLQVVETFLSFFLGVSFTKA